MDNLIARDKIKINSNDGLIIVDIQNDFLTGGSLAVTDGNQIIEGVNSLGLKFKESGARVIFTQDWHPPGHWSFASAHQGKNPFDPIDKVKGIGPILWPDHCIQGSQGANFHEELDVSLAHLIIRKGYHQKIDSYSAILENDGETETGLEGYLKSSKLNRIFICGLALDYCVNFSAIDTVTKGYDVWVVYDLTRGISDQSVHEAIHQMQEAGIKLVELSNFV
ncbi:MAG: bifunctional nicotinamidase/pyrazinamidase [Candidatus Heimdallarchaeota archaeon]|nr:bifunctional nicotinamidase/pyrazinamidase [Candidatus Heimdallarchaeota archaeon]